ncbi:MAG: hypothetical protein WCC37_19260 [Candidatus Sulfotelmatobacter sp.]
MLLIDGTSPDLATAQLAQKPLIDGILASIRCHVSLQAAPPMIDFSARVSAAPA